MAPFARILLRYGTGFLFGKGFGEYLASDPDMVWVAEIALTAAVALAIEGYYVLAKARGWRT